MAGDTIFGRISPTQGKRHRGRALGVPDRRPGAGFRGGPAGLAKEAPDGPLPLRRIPLRHRDRQDKRSCIVATNAELPGCVQSGEQYRREKVVVLSPKNGGILI